MKFFEKLKNVKLVASDFDGTLTDGYVYFREDGKETVRCSRRDSLGMEILQSLGILVIVISKEVNEVVKARCQKMKVPCWHGVEDGDTKLSILQEQAEAHGVAPEEIVFIGDDVNDVPCLEWAGVGVAVADAADAAKLAADAVTRRKGGCHAVREVCDMIIKAKE